MLESNESFTILHTNNESNNYKIDFLENNLNSFSITYPFPLLYNATNYSLNLDQVLFQSSINNISHDHINSIIVFTYYTDPKKITLIKVYNFQTQNKYCSNINELIVALNKGFRKSYNISNQYIFNYSKENDRVFINFRFTYEEFSTLLLVAEKTKLHVTMDLSPRINGMLGFPNRYIDLDIEMDGIHNVYKKTACLKPYLHSGLDFMYIYTNIVKHSFVGHTQSKILQIIPIKINHFINSIPYIFNNKQNITIPIEQDKIQYITIDLRDEFGNFYPLTTGSIYLVLRFNKFNK